MRETATGKRTFVAPGARDDQELNDFPLLRTPAAAALIAKSRIVRVLLSGSPAFRLLMFGSSISMLGTRISTVAFPMLALYLNKSPSVTGLVAFAAFAPSMLVYLPAGVLVDRWNPRRVMLISEVLRGLAIASIVVALAMFGTRVNIWFLLLAMVAEEVFEIFSTLADRRYLHRVMERDKMDSQQAAIEVRAHAVVLAGRPVGPFLFSIMPFLPFLADAVSFIASAGSLILLRRVGEPEAEPQRLAPKRAINEIGNGFTWLKKHRRGWITVLLMAMTSMVAQALILMFLVEAHSKQLSTIAIGCVLAASGAGGAVGSFCSRILPEQVRHFWLPIQMIVWCLALAFLALSGGQSAYYSAGVMFVLGLTGAIGNVVYRTYLVSNIKDDMVAKVTGIGQMLAIGASALGPLFAGYAIQHFHVRDAIYILLGLIVLLVIATWLILAVREQAAARRRGHKEPVADIGPALIEGNDPPSLPPGHGRLSSSIDENATKLATA